MKPDSAISIIRELRRKGHEAYLVGGCVRDMVMHIEPSDYDIATSARPEEVVKLFPRTENIGVQFGVILVIYQGHAFEVATFAPTMHTSMEDGQPVSRLRTRNRMCCVVISPLMACFMTQ